jgi:hypothetical protein
MADIAAPRVEQTACPPNISAAGERRRRRQGTIWAAVTAVLFGTGFRFPGWWAVPVVFLSAAISAVGFLQAARHTCVLRAKEGTFERDDFSTVPAPAADVAASRRVSRGIWRDALAIGAGAAALAVIVRAISR